MCACRITRAASGFDPGPAADNEEMHTGHGDASPDLSDSMASGAGHHHLHARTRSVMLPGFTYTSSSQTV